MVKIKFFSSITEAELAGNVLKGYGIKSMVRRRGIEFPGDLGDSYGADLFVAEEDAEKAREILELSYGT